MWRHWMLQSHRSCCHHFWLVGLFGFFSQLGYVRSMSFISYQEWAVTATLNVTQKTKSRKMVPLPQRGLTRPSRSSPRAKVGVTGAPTSYSCHAGCCQSRDCWGCCRVSILKQVPVRSQLLSWDPDKQIRGELFLALRSQFRQVSYGGAGEPRAPVLLAWNSLRTRTGAVCQLLSGS